MDDHRGSRLLAQSRVAVLYGGTSEEHEVSLESGAGIVRALRTPSGDDDRRGPGKVVEALIERGGAWRVGGRELSLPAALEALAELDLVFLGLHGGDGEDGRVQALLQAVHVPYTGSGVTSSALCMDKLYSRIVVAEAGLRVAAGRELERSVWEATGDVPLDGLGSGGWVVKPRRGGSSVGVSLLREPDELPAALEAAFAVAPSVVLEELVPGVEVSVSVLDLRERDPLGLPPVEITPRPGSFYDYEEKYSDESAALSCPPRSLSEATAAHLCELAVTAHRALGCEGYSRTDFLCPEGEEPVFLETNTLPGMTSHSLLPCSAGVVGMDYRTLCLELAADGLARGRRA